MTASPETATHQTSGRISRFGRSWLFDLALLAGAYGIYTLVRNAVPGERTAALSHARSILRVEGNVGIDAEHSLNSAVAGHPVVANVADYYYATMHFVVVIAVLVWLYWRRRAVARLWAAPWYVMNLLGLLGFWLWPTAPPRLLPGAGFVDTVVRFHTWGSWGNGAVASASNQYAAFPSLHEGWALWAALAVAVNARRTWVKVIACAYPVATGLVVLGTANHYVIDVLAGIVVCLLGFVLAWSLPWFARIRPRSAGLRFPARHRRATVLALVAVIVLVAGGGTVAGVVAHRRSSRQRAAARKLAGQFMADWSADRYTDLAELTTQPAGQVAGYYSATMRNLQATRLSYELGAVTLGAQPHVAFTVHITVAGYGVFAYAGSLPLVSVHGRGWRVDWSPRALHPALGNGERLTLQLAKTSAGHLVDDSGRRIRGADSELTDVVLGATAAAGAEPKLLASELSSTLSGTPAAAVTVVGKDARVVADLHTFAGTPGRNVSTTLDLSLQYLAEQIVDSSGRATSVVAVDTRNDAVKAIADNGAAGEGTALNGRFAPGSTFKIVTATAALENGYTLTTTVNCPPQIDGGGYEFHNAGGESYGPISFEKAFAVSCNTAFIGIAESLPKAALSNAAAFYGCTLLPADAPLKRALSIPSFACNYPPAANAEYAASAFGQGQDQVSPLGMTTICAAAASGVWHAPTVLTDSPMTTNQTTSGRSLPPNVVQELHQAMRAVVTSGTATSIAGTPIAGKTGTAEYGSGTPPLTNAWFTGYLGHYAVTVLVQDAGYGGTDAAPLAAQFLAAAQTVAG